MKWARTETVLQAMRTRHFAHLSWVVTEPERVLQPVSRPFLPPGLRGGAPLGLEECVATINPALLRSRAGAHSFCELVLWSPAKRKMWLSPHNRQFSLRNSFANTVIFFFFFLQYFYWAHVCFPQFVFCLLTKKRVTLRQLKRCVCSGKESNWG